ncbi:hypothetical protein CL65_gp090 [Mycobacterium phage Patience]|uniref:Uncharacterized protein n=2 Tax=Patiencevirus patience TaxID=1982360 RepID=A0A0K1LSE4_9CAUD|nr:hypothetical protein CL65_gp090 [Mycobacterium phage Patience]AEL98016.1 hypothetical protein PATIENCE_108 [Mycobacterium phage Patience]AKU45394.1 hypothetical protein MADRUGA_105 [Mycobacterium phage Madruga]
MASNDENQNSEAPEDFDEEARLAFLQGYCELASETLLEMKTKLTQVSDSFKNLRPEN